MSICDDCTQDFEDCHCNAFLSPTRKQTLVAWKQEATGFGQLSRPAEWAEECPEFILVDRSVPFATADEVRAHRDEEESLDELMIDYADRNRVP